jgi:hypothetical protein
LSCLTCGPIAEPLGLRPTPSQSDASLTVAVRGRGRGGGTLFIARKKNAKIAEIHSIASRFGIKTWLKLNACKKRKGKAFYFN